jgi:hypothetical protein
MSIRMFDRMVPGAINRDQLFVPDTVIETLNVETLGANQFK